MPESVQKNQRVNLDNKALPHLVLFSFDPKEISIFEPQIRVTHLSQFAQFIQEWPALKADVTIVDLSWLKKDQLQQLISMRQQSTSDFSRSLLFVSARVWDPGLIATAVNELKTAHLVAYPFESKETLAQMNLEIHYQRELDRENFLFQESKRQLQELALLNQDLEKIVDERTSSIKVSKEEEDKKLNLVRQLIRFIKELSTTLSFEEFIDQIRKEFHKLHLKNEPFLIFSGHPNEVYLIDAQTQAESKKSFKTTPQQIERWFTDKNFLRTQLANALARPFMPIEIFQIQNSLVRACLLIETEPLLQNPVFLQDHFIERQKVIQLAFEKIFLEEELKKTAQQWEQTFDSFKDPLAILDPTYQVLRANNLFSENFTTYPCFKIFAQKDQICLGCPVEKSLDSAKTEVSVVKIKNKIYEVQSYPILSESGQVSSFLNRYVDMTAQKDLQIKFLQTEKLSQMGKMAGNLSHELNNPIAGLIALAQVLQSQNQNKPELVQDLKEIEKASARCKDIIKNLMDFSLGSSGQDSMLELDDIVQRTLPFLKSNLLDHRYQIDLKTNGLFFRGDSILIQQVVYNLVQNACQAMKESGRLTIQSFFSREDQQVILRIQDTGPGVPAHLQEKIFEPFFTTKSDGQGTGLGLSLSRQIVQKMGGQLNLIPQNPGEGSGANFEVRFPIVRQ